MVILQIESEHNWEMQYLEEEYKKHWKGARKEEKQTSGATLGKAKWTRQKRCRGRSMRAAAAARPAAAGYEGATGGGRSTHAAGAAFGRQRCAQRFEY